MERVILSPQLQQLVNEKGDNGVKIAFVDLKTKRHCNVILKRLEYFILTCTYDSFEQHWIPIAKEDKEIATHITYDITRTYLDSLLWQKSSQTLNLYSSAYVYNYRPFKNDISDMWTKERITFNSATPQYIDATKYQFGNCTKYIGTRFSNSDWTKSLTSTRCDVILYSGPVCDKMHYYKYPSNAYNEVCYWKFGSKYSNCSYSDIPPLMVHICKKKLPTDVPNIYDMHITVANKDDTTTTTIKTDETLYLPNIPDSIQPKLTENYKMSAMLLTTPSTVTDMEHWHTQWNTCPLVISNSVVTEVTDNIPDMRTIMEYLVYRQQHPEIE